MYIYVFKITAIQINFLDKYSHGLYENQTKMETDTYPHNFLKIPDKSPKTNP